MANERLFYDVWLIEPNQLYREVPFTVVSEWARDGRVVGDDKVRVSGQARWHRLSEVLILSPAPVAPAPAAVESSPAAADVPKTVSARRAADLEAELDADLPSRVSRRDEDDDPDMIPLIDISLVLLIFFLMTGKTLTGVSTTETPTNPNPQSIFRPGHRLPVAKYAELIERPNFVAVSIQRDLEGNPLFFVADRTDRPLELDQVLLALTQEIASRDLKPSDVTILLRADETLPFETVQHLTIGLEALQCQEIFAITIEAPQGK